MGTTQLLRGRWIVAGGTDADPVLTDAAIAVVDGRISELGAWADLRRRHPDAVTLGGDDVAIMPGLINAHHHSGGTTYLQHGIEDRLLESWLLTLSTMRPGDIYLDTLLSAARLLRSGVTAVVDVHSGHGSAKDYAARISQALKAYDDSGIRVAFAPGVATRSFLVTGDGQDEKFLGSLPPEARRHALAHLPAAGELGEDDYFAILDQSWQAHRQHPRIDIWFAPPGPQWVSDSCLQRIAETAARYDTGIQTHVSESVYEKLHGPLFYGKSAVEHLRDLGVLGPRFSIAHGVWLNDQEMRIMAETGAAVSHNPSSNLRLRAGIAPLNAYLAAGVTMALGMDGTTLNDDEDFFTEMRLAMRLNRTPRLDGPAPRPRDILAMATAGGAKLMRKETQLGRIAPGFAADLVLVKLDRITWPWVAPEADPRDLLLMRARAGDVDTVLIGGEVVLRQGVPTRFDVAAAGRELAAKLAREPYPAEIARGVELLLPHLDAFYKGWTMPNFDPHTCYNSRT